MTGPLTEFFGLAAVGAVVGTSITAALQIYHDMAARNLAERDAIRDLIARLDEAFRAQKHIKRQLRSRNIGAPASAPAAAMAASPATGAGAQLEKPWSYRIPMDYLLKRMDQLSRLQLTLEEIRQIIRSRVDLFTPEQIDRLLDLIHYAEKYLHGIVDEFEECSLRVDGGNCAIDDRRPRIADFLRSRWTTNVATTLSEKLGKTSDPKASYNIILELFDEADRDFGRKPGQKSPRRTKAISDLCLRAALWEMREELVFKSRPIWARGTKAPTPQADIHGED
jgi:hypothetical protein